MSQLDRGARRGIPEPTSLVGKLVVLGAGEAGKSTLISALCQDAMNLEVRGRTVAMDHGLLREAGRRLSVIGLPGQERFATVQDALIRGATAAVWVHAGPAEPDAATVARLRALALPYCIFVNFRATEVRRPFRLPPDLPTPFRIVIGDLRDPACEGLSHLRIALWEMIDAP